MLSVLYPLWLIAIPIVGALLVFAYLRHGKGKQHKTSSLFFIKQLAPSILNARKKISLPWRILIELAILTCIITALSGLIFNRSSEQAIFVIDNSLSMSAQNIAGQQTRLDEAKQSAISNLDFFSEIKSASIWVTSPKPREITNGFVNKSQAKQAILDINIQYSKGNLNGLLGRLDQEVSKILIFSDQILSNQSTESKFRQVPLSVGEELKNNIAIEKLFLEKTIGTSMLQAIVNVKSYSSNLANCKVTLSRLERSKWAPISSKDFSLANLESKEIQFELSDTNKESLKASLSCSNPNVNLLNADDNAWLTSNQEHENIKIISNFTAQQLGLDRIPNLSKESIRPEDWSADLEDDSSILIFHRATPAKLPVKNSLFISPPENNNFLKTVQLGSNSKIIRWQTEHPILKYLQLPEINIPNASLFVDLPVWANPLIHSSQGPIGISAEMSGHRYIALGFEILPFEGRNNPFLSILFLNSLKWLSNQSGESQADNSLYLRSKSPIKSIKVVDSALNNIQPIISSDNLSAEINSPGLFEISNEKLNYLSAINLYLQQESNLKEPGYINLPKDNSKDQKYSTSGLELESILIYIALLILAVDSVRFLRRRNA